MFIALLLEMSLSVAAQIPADEPLPPGAIVRLGTAKLGHYAPVTWVGFSADGRAVLTAGSEQRLRFWDVKSGFESAYLDAYSGPREAIALSLDCKRLFVLNYRDDVLLIDVATRKEIRSFKAVDLFGAGDDALYCWRFTLSPTGRFLAIWDNAFAQNMSWGDNKKRREPFLHIWDLDEGRRVQQWKTGEIYEAEFTPDGSAVIAQEKTKDGKATLIGRSLASGKETCRVDLPRALNRFTFLPDGRSFVGLDGDGMALRRYDAYSGKEVAVLLNDRKPIFSFALSADGQRFVAAQPGRIGVHRIATGETIRAWPTRTHSREAFGFRDSMAEIVAFSPDGSMIAAADSRKVALWDIQTGARQHTDDANSGPLIGVHVHGQNVLVRDMEFDVTLWDLRTGKLRRRFECAPPKDENGAYSPLYESLHCGVGFQAVAPDGRKIAALWPNAPMQLIDLTGANAPICFEESELASCLAFSPNGKFLAAPLPDGRIGAWDTATGKRVRQFASRFNPGGGILGDGATIFNSLCFTSDGRSLFGGFYTETHHRHQNLQTSEIMMWEIATGGVRRHLEPGLFADRAHAFVNTPDGKQVAILGSRSILLVDALTAKEVRRLGGSTEIIGHSAAFSPDGKLLAVGLDSGAVRFWEVATGTVLGDAPAHASRVTALAFADANTLVTASIDRTAIVWDVKRLLVAATTPANVAEAELEKLWTDLGHHEAEKAASAMAAFVAHRSDAVAFFKRRLQPAPGARPDQIAQWLADLRSEQYTVRHRASTGLAKLGGHARSGLEKALNDAKSAEERRRLETLLHKLDDPITDTALLRAVRAIEVLERIGNSDARRLLDDLAAGGTGHRLTDDARGSIARLAK